MCGLRSLWVALVPCAGAIQDVDAVMGHVNLRDGINNEVDTGTRSEDLQDRRGRPRAKTAAVVGIPGVIVVLLAMFLGGGSGGGGGHYCPADGTVYIDLDFFRQLSERYGPQVIALRCMYSLTRSVITYKT